MPDTWAEKAACKGEDTEDWYPVSNILTQANENALELCSWCPVRLPCLQTAIDAKIDYGIWGGVIAEDRRKLIKRMERNKRKITLVDVEAVT
jgi:WhiB family redox-sensing transcriptional regulator